MNYHLIKPLGDGILNKEDIIIVKREDIKEKWKLVREDKVKLISIFPMIIKEKNE